MFSLKIRTVYNIISRAEKEGRPDLKGYTGMPKKVLKPFMLASNPVREDEVFK